jgi:hypothetical protein
MNNYELARRFAANVRAELTEEQLAEVCSRNDLEENASICHSHDFTDANVLMLEAWQSIEDVELEKITHDEKRSALWASAWAIARDNEFDEGLIDDAETNYQRMMGR